MSRPKKPCDKHPGVPRDHHRQCPECKRAYMAAWQKANPARVAAKTKRWRDKDSKNREQAIEATRRWHVENPLYNRLKVAKRKAKIIGVGGSLSRGLFERLMVAQGGRCVYCRVELASVKPNMDHIMPLALGGAHEDQNIQLLCETCNRQKRSKHPEQFAREKGISSI